MTSDPPAKRHSPQDLISPNISTETSSLTILRFNKEREIFYVLTKQQVLKKEVGKKIQWLGGTVSFCVLKCYEMISANPLNMCVKTSKHFDGRLKIPVFLLYLSAVDTVTDTVKDQDL
jgi:hypothetical protein